MHESDTPPFREFQAAELLSRAKVKEGMIRNGAMLWTIGNSAIDNGVVKIRTMKASFLCKIYNEAGHL